MNLFAVESRGVRIELKDGDGQTVGFYQESHALLIGISDYTAGWPDLDTVPIELSKVEDFLKAQSFNVVKSLNPTGQQLKRTFEDFINQYGFNPENRLLFFFAGHGYTREGTKGYLVPADAPDPRSDELGFLRKALGMNQIMAWSRQVEDKHALFLFDSCFSGTVFMARDLPERPPHISHLTAKPVRQYITAGAAGETVPASSTFTPAFIDAIRHGLGELDDDGYVTGTELGVYLQGLVPRRTRHLQTHQFAKITDYDLSRGDFVFAIRTIEDHEPPSWEKVRPEGLPGAIQAMVALIE